MKLGEVLRSGDWASEKYVPVIDVPDSVVVGEPVEIKVSIGEGVFYPNIIEYYISWIKFFFQPQEGFIFELADIQFTAHGEGIKGANEGPCFTEPAARVTVRLKQSGTLLALSYCNIHGLWESSKQITVQ